MYKLRRYGAYAKKGMLIALAVLGLSFLPASDGVMETVGTPTEEASAIGWGNSPIVYRQAGNHWTPMYGLPDTDQYTVVIAWLAPGEPFRMHCWVDARDAWHYKNYSTRRWFYGWSRDHGYGVVHASFVYYQKRVPRC